MADIFDEVKAEGDLFDEIAKSNEGPDLFDELAKKKKPGLGAKAVDIAKEFTGGIADMAKSWEAGHKRRGREAAGEVEMGYDMPTFSHDEIKKIGQKSAELRDSDLSHDAQVEQLEAFRASLVRAQADKGAAGARRTQEAMPKPQFAEDAGFFEKAARGIIHSGPAMVTTGLSGPPGLVAMFQLLRGGKLDELEKKRDAELQGVKDSWQIKEIKDKYSDQKNMDNATLHSVLSTPVEQFGTVMEFGFLKKMLKSSGAGSRLKEFLKNMSKNSLTEGVEEWIQTHTELIADKFQENPNKPGGEVWDEVYDEFWTWKHQGKAGEAAALGATGAAMMMGAPAGAVNIAQSIEQKAALSDLTSDERGQLNANPLLTADDLRKERDAPKEVTEDSFGTLEEDIEDSGIQVTDNSTVMNSGLGDRGTIILEEKLRTTEETNEAAKSAREQEQNRIEAEKQQAAQAAEEQARIVAEKQQAEKEKVERDAQEMFDMSIAARPGLINQSITAVAALESSPDPAIRKAVTPIRKAQQALSVREDSAKRLMTIQNDLRVELKRATDTRAVSLMTRLDQELEVEVEKADFLTAQLEAQKAEREAEAQAKKEEPTAKTAAAPVPSAPAAPVAKKPAPATVPKQKYDEYKTRAAEAVARGKVVKAEKIAKTKAAIERVKKQQEIVTERKAAIKTKETVAAQKLVKTQAAIAAQKKKYGIKYKVSTESTAGQISDSTVVAGTPFKETIKRVAEGKSVRQTLSKVAKQGRSFYVDVMHPSKIGARIYQQQRQEGLSPTEAKISVTHILDKYGLTYDQVAARFLKVTKPEEGMRPTGAAVPDTKGIAKEVSTALRRSKVHLAGVTGVNVISSDAELRATNPALYAKMAVAKSLGTADALFDPSTKQIYVFTNLADTVVKAKQAVWHELGHFSLGELLGKDLDAVLKLTSEKYKNRVEDKMLEGYPTPALATEEVLIDMFTKNETNSAVSKFKNLWDKFVRKLGFVNGEITESDVRDLVAKIRKRLLTGKAGKPVGLIKLGDKKYPEAKNEMADAVDKLSYSLNPKMVKRAIDVDALSKESIHVSEVINEFHAIDLELKKALKAAKTSGILHEMRPSAINIDKVLTVNPKLKKKIMNLADKEQVTMFHPDGRFWAHPIEARTKMKGKLPKFGGFRRSLVQTYLDQMGDTQREVFRGDILQYIEKAYEDKSAPLDFGRSLLNLTTTEYAIPAAIKVSEKTLGALNLNSMCPMFNIGSHGCYFDGCYVTGMGKGGNTINLFRSAMYLGEILQLSDAAIAELNKVGGLRVNGVGDTTYNEKPQWRDFMKHAGMRGLKLKVITKQEDTFKIMAELQDDPDVHVAFKAQETIVQTSSDPYWVPVEVDDIPGSLVDEMGLNKKKGQKFMEGVVAIYKQMGRDAMIKDGNVYRKYGFSVDQINALAKKYPNVKVLPRTVVGTPKEIAETALKTPKILQTWMHAKIRPGMYSSIEDKVLGKDELGNFDRRIFVGKIDGEWRVQLQAKGKAMGEIEPRKAYQAVEDYIKKEYSPEDQEKIFKTLSTQLSDEPGSLCCTVGASQDACNDCTAHCNVGTYYTGDELVEATENLKFHKLTFKSRREHAMERQAELAKFATPTRKPKRAFRPGRIVFTKAERERRVQKQKAQVKSLIIGGIKKGAYTGAVRFAPMASIGDIIKVGKITETLHATPILGKDYDAIPAYGDNTQTPAAMIVDEKYVEPKPDAHTNEAYISKDTPISEITFIFPTGGKNAVAKRFPPNDIKYKVNTPAFKKWFKKSVINERGKPIELYHGTTHDFSEFDPSTAYLENFLGRSLYFTDSPEDASSHYGTIQGADIKSRISKAQEEIRTQIEEMDSLAIAGRWPELSNADINAIMGTTTEEEHAKLLKELATKEIAGQSQGSVMPVYVRIERPLYLNGEKETDFILEPDWVYYEEQANDDISREDYNNDEDYKDDLREKAQELYFDDYDPIESGNMVDLKNAFFEVADEYNLPSQDIWNAMRDDTNYEYEVAASNLFAGVMDHNDIQELMDDTGEYVNREFMRDWIERAGYDGAVLDARKQFPGMFQSFAGGDITHYMPFQGRQVKSVFNMGDWSPVVDDIRYSKKQLEDNGLEGVAFRHPKTKKVYAGRPGQIHTDVITEHFGDELDGWPEFDNALDMGYITTTGKKFVNRTEVAKMMGFQRPESAESISMQNWGKLKYSKTQIKSAGFKSVAFQHPETGKIYKGDPDQTHTDILIALYEDDIDQWPDFDDYTDMGYIDMEDKFVPRREAAIRLGEVYADSDIMRGKAQLPRYKLTPAQQNALDHIGLREGKKKDSNLLEMTWMDKFMQKMADSLRAIGKMEQGKDLGTQSGYKSFNMLSNFPAMFSTFLNNGRVIFKDNWMAVRPEKEGGLFTVQNELGDQADNFFKRLTAKSAKEILDRDAATVAAGKPSRFKKGVNLFGKDFKTGEQLNDRKMVKDLLAGTVIEYRANKELWDRAEKRLKELNTSVLDMAEKSNLIDPAARKKFERQFYVPFFRIMEDMEGDVETMFPKTGDPTHIAKMHKLAGSHKNIGDPFNNLVNNYSFILHESLKNLARGKSLNLAKQLGLIEVTRHAGKNTVGVRVKGQKTMYDVKDALLYKALVDVDTITNGWMSKGLGKMLLRNPKLWLTKFVTYDPSFRIANFLRDTLHTSFMQKGFIPVVSSLRGGYHALWQTDEFKEFASTGGAFTGAYHERDVLAKTAEEVKKLKKRVSRKAKGGKRFLNPITYLDMYRAIGEASENAARMGVYMIQKRQGKTGFEAAYAAKDLLDFHRSGTSGFLSFLTQTVPFLNARIQGMYKLGRTATDAQTRKNFFVMAAILSAATTAYFFMGPGDDERYKELTDADKMMYWHFYDVPGLGHVKIPKPFEVGAFFGSIPEAFMEYVAGQRNGKELASYTMKIFRDMLRLDMPQSAKVLVQQWANKDYFTGAPIIPSRQAGARVEVQYGERTSKLARLTGKGIEKLTGDSPWASPRRIDKVFQDLFSYGTYLSTYATDKMIQQMDLFPADPALADGEGFSRLILGTGRFIKGEQVPKYTKSQQQFYEMMQEVNAAADTFRIYKRMKNIKEAKRFKKEHKREIRIAKKLNNWQRQISKYNQKIDITLASTKYNAQEKRDRIDKLILQRLEVFKKATAWGKKKLDD